MTIANSGASELPDPERHPGRRPVVYGQVQRRLRQRAQRVEQSVRRGAVRRSSLTELWAIPVQFDLLSAFNGAPSAVLVTTDDSLASVSAVPEPSSLLLMLLARWRW
ncbi:hypothetical protein LP420_07945 [Massilia sp. B-10]|nr:hypothetical protein LP420_07945 [Massilia sp. B-10]